jgi:hypothetical protein
MMRWSRKHIGRTFTQHENPAGCFSWRHDKPVWCFGTVAVCSCIVPAVDAILDQSALQSVWGMTAWRMRSGLFESTNACHAKNTPLLRVSHSGFAGGFTILHPLHSIAWFYFVLTLIRGAGLHNSDRGASVNGESPTCYRVISQPTAGTIDT